MSSRPSPIMAQQGRLYRKYAIYIVSAVCVVLLAGASTDIYFTRRDLRSHLAELQRVYAVSAAGKIERFVSDIETQSSGVRTFPAEFDPPALRLEAQRLLRQAQAVTDVRLVDGSGRERLFVSRLDIDRTGDDRDMRADEGFRVAKGGAAYYSPVYFRKETEPYMTIALPQAWQGGGVAILEVNLKAVWDVIAPIRIGQSGFAYAVDRNGSLFAHPDISLVLRKLNLRSVPEVAAALSSETRESPGATINGVTSVVDVGGSRALSTYVRLPALGWIVFVHQSLAEVDGPVYAAVARTGVLLFAGLVLAFAMALTLARRMVSPIEAIREGAEQLASGVYEYRIDVRSGDELEAVASQFNSMAAKLQEAHADLERKVEARTRELETANRAQKRFLAVASHDLRQPVYALGLLISSLRGKTDPVEIQRIVARAGTTIELVAELLDNLLDISKLDVGVVQPNLKEFPIAALLERISSDFAPETLAKNVILRVAPSSVVVRSDPLMLGRILLNLVSNAIRSTPSGKILVGCRRRKGHIRVEVWDTGIGIEPDHQQAIFQEFYKAPNCGGGAGLGLGLSIVTRLADLLECKIELSSVVGKGSKFTVVVPTGDRAADAAAHESASRSIGASLAGRSVLLIDDDPAALDAMRKLLADWGCNPMSAQTADEAADRLDNLSGRADVIICAYKLEGCEIGVEILRRLTARSTGSVAAILTATDADVDALRVAGISAYPILHKPLRPAKLRSLMTHVLGRVGESVSDSAPIH